MSEAKTYIFPDSGNSMGSNGLLASILPSLQQRGLDTSYLMGLMSNNGNNGFFGNNGGFQDIIALIVIAAIFGNGNFGFGNNNNNSSTERELLMSAIQRNGVDLSQLASSLNCSVGRLQDAIGNVSTQICNLAGQQGLSFQQVINSIQAGNCAITNQIAQCCCDVKQAINGVNVGLERGFSSVASETQRQTCNIEKAIASSTEQILAGQRAAEMREMQRELSERDRELAKKDVIINNAQQTATFSQMLTQATTPLYQAINGVQEDVNGIKCKLPRTETIVAQPNYVPVNYGVNVGLAPYNACGCFGLNGVGLSTGFPGGWNNGGSLWG